MKKIITLIILCTALTATVSAQTDDTQAKKIAVCLFRVFCGVLNQKIFVFFRVFSWFLFNSSVAV